ncbi:glycoside hydrolase family 3 C-terminal domain-containing protein [Cerasicoccus fimbriatus]|uniref:glycoside hydrolase family 3 C-terminal domain-containing protein n=1 Tax=Cerasicoccus fimbriatus TaxID=3014554 RepID=UPI0022B3028E|nr:glycoside hydrolase family 3 C-terminal domain-containing protein [Cerasicoccus sp. TK19100]
MSVDKIAVPPLEEQLRLFAGLDAWNFPGVPSMDIPPMQVADCGHGVTLVAPPYGSASCFPTSVGMAATWNPALIEEVGAALGRETRAKNCRMLLGPMVNLHRLPCGGRNYETFSEDPVLAGKMASAIIRGIQSEGTSACIKSFACNNQQFDQKKISAEVDPRTLRELYLKIFAIAFREADPWAVMTCYNPINGEYPGDSREWLQGVLRDEMGFDGFIVSDWTALQGEGAIQSSCDMEMPGPGKVLTAERLRDALDRGLIDEAEIQRRMQRLIDLYEKCEPARKGERYSPPELDSPRHRAVAQRAAEEAITLLKNDGAVLPLDRSRIKRLAVIGPNAANARLGGGGSASVSPYFSISPLQGIRDLVGDDAEVLFAEGCSQGSNLPTVHADYLAPSGSDFGKGLTAEYFEVKKFLADDAPSVTQTDAQIDFSWGWASPATGLPRNDYVVRWTGKLRLPQPGKYRFSIATQEGIGRVDFDGETVIDCWNDFDEGNFESAYANLSGEFELEITKAREVELLVIYRKTKTRGGMHFGWETPFSQDPIEEAVELAKTCDAVVIAGGLSNQFEGGACDRKFFELPGRQAELIRRVAAANPQTVVVLKNGTPVDYRDWLDSVPALLEAYYPGQAGGAAIANVLFGEVNPSGKLPDTHPNCWEEVPSMHYYPGENGKTDYGEGLMVGYRHYDTAGLAPVFPFGFGLSYTTFEIGAPQLVGTLHEGGEIALTVPVTNTGDRAGKEVVQIYLEWVNPPAGRPPRALIDFAKVKVAPGETREAMFAIPYRELLTYNPASAAWELEHHEFNICVGNSSRSLQRIPLPLN